MGFRIGTQTIVGAVKLSRPIEREPALCAGSTSGLRFRSGGLLSRSSRSVGRDVAAMEMEMVMVMVMELGGFWKL